MGEVYNARDTRLDRTVAIKIVSETLAGDPHLRERFDREARAISQLNHPHVCTLGWAKDGRLVTMAMFTTGSLWRFRPENEAR